MSIPIAVDGVTLVNAALLNSYRTAILALGGGASSITVTNQVTQTTHGFTVGQVVRYTGATYALARADVQADAIGTVGIVTTVIDANNFIYTEAGWQTGFTGLTQGTVYYLSPTTPGLLTSTAPTGGKQVFMPLLVADSSTTGVVLPPVVTIIPNNPLTIAEGGTGAGTAAGAFNALSPLTTLGDVLYGGASGAGTRLAGPTSSTKQFFTSTGTGSAAQPPAWGTIATGDLPTIPIAGGGTGQTTATAGFNALSPLTTLGDLLYGGSSGAGTRLAGPTSSTKQFLSSTGTGSAAQAPAWGTIATGDLPVIPTTGGGTGQNWGATAQGGIPYFGATGVMSILAAGTSGQTLKQGSGNTPQWITPGDGIFGDGSDGVVTLSTNTTLTRDMFYSSLTINNNVQLNTNGFKVFVTGTLTFGGANSLIYNEGTAGGAGGNGSGTTGGTGGTAGLGAPGGSLPASAAGVAGLAGAAGLSTAGNGTNGANGNAGTNTTNSIGSGAAAGAVNGGGGGNAGGNTGGLAGLAGSAGSATALAAASGGVRQPFFLVTWRAFPMGSAPVGITGYATSGSGGSGGSGAAGAGVTNSTSGAGGGSGGSGGAGGAVFVAAKIITGAGTIRANGAMGGPGGNGAAAVGGADAVAVGGGGGGAGGNGGPGGVIGLLYGDNTGFTGVTQANGGVGGAGGSGGAGANGGSAGTAPSTSAGGVNGTIISLGVRY